MMRGNRSRVNRPPISVEDWDKIRELYRKSVAGEIKPYLSWAKIAKQFGYSLSMVERCISGVGSPGKAATHRPSLAEIDHIDVMLGRGLDCAFIAESVGVKKQFVQKRARKRKVGR